MKLKFFTISLLALAVATTVALTGCTREETTEVETPEAVTEPAEAPATSVEVEETEAAPAEGEAMEAAPAEEAHTEGEAAH